LSRCGPHTNEATTSETAQRVAQVVEADCAHTGSLQRVLVALAEFGGVERMAGVAEDQVVIAAVGGALEMGLE
jgi:hypothetical protein